MTELSMDAKVLATGMFMAGSRAKLLIGGEGSISTLSKRAKVALEELIEQGYIKPYLYNNYGRMLYHGTDKLDDFKRLSFTKMNEHGAWPATVKHEHVDAGGDLSDHAAKYKDQVWPGHD